MISVDRLDAADVAYLGFHSPHQFNQLGCDCPHFTLGRLDRDGAAFLAVKIVMCQRVVLAGLFVVNTCCVTGIMKNICKINRFA